MILGIGADLCDIRRIDKLLTRFGTRFTHRCFTEQERAKAEHCPKTRAASYAKRFAAKEAAAKALGIGFQEGLSWQDLCVQNTPLGRPTLHFLGKATQILAQRVPPGWQALIHLTLTDESPLAFAQVMIEARPLTLMELTLDSSE